MIVASSLTYSDMSDQTTKPWSPIQEIAGTSACRDRMSSEDSSTMDSSSSRGSLVPEAVDMSLSGRDQEQEWIWLEAGCRVSLETTKTSY